MPRMNLTEEEQRLITEYRRKTEVDRTHNAALDIAFELAKDVIEKHIKHPALAPEMVKELETMIEARRRHV